MDLLITGPLILVAAISSTNNVDAKNNAAIAAYKQTGMETITNNLTNRYVDKTMEEKLTLLFQANQLLINKSITVRFNF
jgi:cytochrome oxidase Cu insertion factor (SCO1/SenC/PrrC family)